MQGLLNLSEDDEFVGYRISIQTAAFLDKLVAAMDVCREHQRASTSLIQRYAGFGYNEAAFIIEQLERLGLVSAADERGKREVSTFVYQETNSDNDDDDDEG